MNGIVSLQTPCTRDEVKGLKVGQRVRLSGRVFTSRDRVHRHLYEGGACPVDLSNGTVYHCGPIVTGGAGAWVIRAAGPSTSARQEAFMAALIERYGLRVVLGKGGMGDATRRACRENGCVYMQIVGGSGSEVVRSIQEVEDVHFLDEFGSAEAMWVLRMADLDAIVTINARGWSLHDRVRRASHKALRALLQRNVTVS